MQQTSWTTRPVLVGGVWTLILGMMLAALFGLSSNPTQAQPGDGADPKRPDSLTTYPVPAALQHLIAGPDGNLWATDRAWASSDPPYSRLLYRVTPQGVVTTYTLPYIPGPLTVGPDNNIWIAGGDAQNTQLVRYDIVGGTTTAYSLPITTTIVALVTGPDGNLWMTGLDLGNYTNDAIIRCTPTGTCTRFPLNADLVPRYSLAVGADGNLWFPEISYYGTSSAIGRITPAGVVSDFMIPNNGPSNTVAPGPDGNIWFVLRAAIGRITPAGTMTIFPNTEGHIWTGAGITAGPDGNVWFTQFDYQFARATTQGAMTWYSGGGYGGDIVTGPDNNIWMADYAHPVLIKANLTDGIPLPTGIPTTVGSPGPPTPIPTAPPTVPVPICGMSWADVPVSSGFYPPVTNLACRNIVTGYPCGGVNPQTGQAEPCTGGAGAAPASGPPYYRPGNWVSRGQSAKIIALSARLSGRVNRQTFADVPATSPFFTSVEALVAHGLANGYRCGNRGEPCDDQNRPYFRPNVSVTRGQLAKLIGGAANLGSIPPGQIFADVSAANGFYGWVQQVGSRGIIGGYACGGPHEPCDSAHRPYYRPGDPATRAQTAKIDAGVFP